MKIVAKKLIKSLLAFLLFYSGLNWLHQKLFMKNRCVILMYHRVLDKKEVTGNIHPAMYVTSDVFEKHIRYLLKQYELISLDDFVLWKEKKKSFRKTPCIITFDDGWKDNYKNAFPIINSKNIPVTIFLIADEIGKDEMLSWEQIEKMQKNNIRFGSHTMSHRILTELTNEELERELLLSREVLRKNVQKYVDWFCYPKGKYDNRAVDIVEKNYVGAVTTNAGTVNINDDCHILNRIGMHEDVSWNTPLFACRIGILR